MELYWIYCDLFHFSFKVRRSSYYANYMCDGRAILTLTIFLSYLKPFKTLPRETFWNSPRRPINTPFWWFHYITIFFEFSMKCQVFVGFTPQFLRMASKSRVLVKIHPPFLQFRSQLWSSNGDPNSIAIPKTCLGAPHPGTTGKTICGWIAGSLVITIIKRWTVFPHELRSGTKITVLVDGISTEIIVKSFLGHVPVRCVKYIF